MRLQIRNIIAIFAMAFAVSCASADADLSTPDIDYGASDAVGYLSLDNLSLYVESEEIGGVTKATQINTDDYLIIIKNISSSSDDPISYSYAEVSKEGFLIELPIGSYTLMARSCEEEDIEAVSETAVFASEEYSFSIASDQVTTPENKIICTLANVKVSIEMSIDLLDSFDVANSTTPLTITIAFGDATHTYSYNDIINGDLSLYYAVGETSNMTLTLHGMYNIGDGYTEVTWVQDITGVEAGQYRVISINYANYSDGNIHIEFTIDAWESGGSIGTI